METETPRKKVQSRERQRRKRDREKKSPDNTFIPFSSSEESDESSENSQNIRQIDGQNGNDVDAVYVPDVANTTDYSVEEVADDSINDNRMHPDIEDLREQENPQDPEDPNDPDDPSDPGDPEDVHHSSDTDVRAAAANNPRITGQWFANQLAKVSATSDVSDAGIQKILDVMLPNLHAISDLLEEGHITKSYRHGIKPKAQFNLPKIWCSAKVLKHNRDEDDEVLHLVDLSVIPQKYVDPRCGTYTLLWQEAHTTLAEIKAHFINIHPSLTPEECTRIFQDASLGLDGVRETEPGTRTLSILQHMLEK